VTRLALTRDEVAVLGLLKGMSRLFCRVRKRIDLLVPLCRDVLDIRT
jgi:hypothetical protein